MDVARLNFSHGAHADHATAYQRVREASDRTGRAVAVLADLQGPKIRLGTFADGPGRVAHRQPGRASPSTTSRAPPSACPPPTRTSPTTSRVGDRLLVDDGKLALTVVAVEGPDVFCLVVEGGPVSNNKGLSLPGVAVSVPGAVGEGRGGPPLRPAPGRSTSSRCPSSARPATPSWCARSCGRRTSTSRSSPSWRSRRRWRTSRRSSRRSTAIMVARGDLGVELAARAGAAGAEAGRPGGPRAQQAGHRRHPDARVDDRRTRGRPAPRPPTSPTPSSTAPTR